MLNILGYKRVPLPFYKTRNGTLLYMIVPLIVYA